VIWDELKWPDVRKLDKAIPVVIPLGSIEQHGLHLPICTDTTQVTSIVERVAAKLEDQALFLPTLWLGSSHHHLDFPGTLSIRPTLYTQVIQDLALSILHAGFKRLFFLNGHGGNEVPAAQALSELAATAELGKSALLVMSSWWAVGKPDAIQLGLKTDLISHACEYETSLMLFLRPDLVDHGRAVDIEEPIKTPSLSGGKRVQLYRRFAAMTKTGNLGSPTAATAEKGESILRAVVDDISNFVKELATWPLPEQLGPLEHLQ
jgi:creatinine amidohydrolase